MSSNINTRRGRPAKEGSIPRYIAEINHLNNLRISVQIDPGLPIETSKKVSDEIDVLIQSLLVITRARQATGT
jgi:hypothetical protein